MPVAAAGAARPHGALHGGRVIRRGGAAYDRLSAAAAGSRGGARRRPRARHLSEAWALGGAGKVQLFRAALPGAGVPHAARTGDLVLRGLLQSEAREDAAELFATGEFEAFRSHALDDDGRGGVGSAGIPDYDLSHAAAAGEADSEVGQGRRPALRGGADGIIALRRGARGR